MQNIAKYTNSTLIWALVAIPTAFGVFRMPTEMGISAGAIAVAWAFMNIDKFERFKAPGFEAELRKAVDKTYAAIEELKELSLALSAPIVDTLAVSGQMLRYMPLKYKMNRVAKIQDTLRRLGANDKEIEDACSTIYERLATDHVRGALNALRLANEGKAELFKGWDEWDTTSWHREKIERFINDNGLSKGPEVDERLLDLDYFTSTKMLRRPEKWQS